MILTKDEILNLPEIRYGESGVYFLLRDGDIAYIGSSVNVAARSYQHTSDGKAFDRTVFLAVPVNESRTLEKIYIQEYAPPLNKTYNPNYAAEPLLGADAVKVYIRIPPAELVQHKRDAKAMGLSLSAYLRLCINGVMKSHQEPPKES